MKPFIATISEIKVQHRGHFFDKQAMSFFSSRLPSTGLFQDGIYYFISSEQFKNGLNIEPRKYTIRRLRKLDGQFIADDKDIFAFQKFDSLATAKRHLDKYLGEPKFLLVIGLEIRNQLTESGQYHKMPFSSIDKAYNFVLQKWGSGSWSYAPSPTTISVEAIK